MRTAANWGADPTANTRSALTGISADSDLSRSAAPIRRAAAVIRPTPQACKPRPRATAKASSTPTITPEARCNAVVAGR
jgi:hypothetical protein